MYVCRYVCGSSHSIFYYTSPFSYIPTYIPTYIHTGAYRTDPGLHPRRNCPGKAPTYLPTYHTNLPTYPIYLLITSYHVMSSQAQEPQPPFPASIMDGYAVVAADGPGR